MHKYFSTLALVVVVLLQSCNNATDVPANRNVTGTPTTNVTSLKPVSSTAGDFGAMASGTKNSKDILIENSSTTESVSITTIALEKGNQSFTIENLPALPLTVAAKGALNSSFNLKIRFDAPATAGNFEDAIVLNGATATAIKVTARIMTVPPDTIDINTDCSVTPTVLDFDTLTNLIPTRTMTFTLSNNDTDSYMRIPAPVWSGSNFITPFTLVSPSFPQILPPSSQVTVTVTASAGAGGMLLTSGQYQNGLSFGNVVGVNCTVIVVGPNFNQITTSDKATDVAVGASVNFTVSIVNNSTSVATLTSLPTISNAGFDCSFMVNAILPVTIPANGGTASVYGTLTGKATGSYTATAAFGITAGAGVSVDNECLMTIRVTP